jgi:hypothetical protein
MRTVDKMVLFLYISIPSLMVFAIIQNYNSLNHKNYSECIEINAAGNSVQAQLDSMPKAKQLCRELYPDNINNKN